MIKFILAAGVFACVAGLTNVESNVAAVPTNKIEKMAASGKWVKLFDGKTTNGWHTYGQPVAGNIWKVQDGSLFLDQENADAAQRGDLVTDNEYENFHLKLEWKISEGGNSGIIFFVNEDKIKYPSTFNSGPEMQVLDNERHADAKIIKHRAGDLYDLISSKVETVKRVGKWNKAEIVANQGRLDFYLNGTNVVSTTVGDKQWKEMVANSKFATMPGFGIYKKGKIALQDHGDKVWYRNIKIREL